MTCSHYAHENGLLAPEGINTFKRIQTSPPNQQLKETYTLMQSVRDLTDEYSIGSYESPG